MLPLWTSRAHLLHDGHGQQKSAAKSVALDVIAKKRITCSWPHKLVINSMPAHPLMPSVSLLQSQSRVWHPNSAEATTMMCFLLGCRVRGPVSVFLHPPCATLRSICLVTPTGSRSYVHHTVANTMRTLNLFSLDKRFQLFLAASRGSVASSVVVSFSPGCIQNTTSDNYIFLSTSWGIFSRTPEPHIAFCPIFVHALFPCLNPMFKNGSFLSVVAL